MITSNYSFKGAILSNQFVFGGEPERSKSFNAFSVSFYTYASKAHSIVVISIT